MISDDEDDEEEGISQFTDSQFQDDEYEDEDEDDIQPWTPGKSAKKKATPPQYLLTSPPPLVFETDVRTLPIQSRKASDGMGSLTSGMDKLALQGALKTRYVFV